jgi:uncharacterized protein (DUF934 family)
MEIIRNREIVEDHWIRIDDQQPLPASGDVIVSLARWLAEKDALLGREGKVGVYLGPDDEVDAIGPDAQRLPLIAISFPVFSDGRGYSQARLLRQRFGFAGELRAVGNVLQDQLFYMARCGINAYELTPGKSLQDALAAFGDFSVTYQPAADDPRPLFRRVERGQS